MKQPTFWDLRRKAALELEADLPAKRYLRDLVNDHGARLQKAFGQLGTLWLNYDAAQAWQAEALLKCLAEEFIDAVANLNRALPTSSICICPSKECQTVTLPTASGAYRCQCGRSWYHHRAANFKSLPMNFWEKALPGQRVPKTLLSDEQQDDVKAHKDAAQDVLKGDGGQAA